MAGLKNLKKRRRVQVILVAAVALALSTALSATRCATGSTSSARPARWPRRRPAERGVPHRRAGRGRHARARAGRDGHLRVTDGGASIPVSYTGVLPDLFGEGEGMVGTGTLCRRRVPATEILAKHDETYMPAEVIDALKEQGVYVDPDRATLPAHGGLPTN
jgi:cytochrome c-type biogenesis protein CcmE